MSDYSYAPIPTATVIQESWYPKLVYALSIFFLVLFGVVGTILAFRDPKSTSTAANFVKASKSTGYFISIWAFYASAVGAWVVLQPAQFSGGPYAGGWMAAVSYGFFSGTPLPTIAVLGLYLRRKAPNVISFGDFIRMRYGLPSFCLTQLIMALNMAMYLLTEYTAIASIFQDYVDPARIIKRPDLLMVILTAVIPAIYTALGGLKVSLYTDQIQGILGVVMSFFVFCWIAANFHKPLSQEAFDTKQLGRGNYTGATSFGSFAISLLCPSIYNEAFWQRTWAAKSNKVLLVGACVGGTMAAIVVFLFGAVGVISAWADLTPLDQEGNLTFFTIFEDRYSDWITVLLIVLTVSMNSGLVDSLQNGLLSTFTATFLVIDERIQHLRLGFGKQNNQEGLQPGKSATQGSNSNGATGNKFDGDTKTNTNPEQEIVNGEKEINQDDPEIQQRKRPQTFAQRLAQSQDSSQAFSLKSFTSTLWIRAIVLCLQVILIPVSLQGYSLLNIFFVANLITTFLAGPQVLGIIFSPLYFKEYQELLSCAAAFIAPHVYAIAYLRTWQQPLEYSTRNVFQYVWDQNVNAYDYLIFLTTFFGGIFTGLIFISIELVIDLARGKLSKNNWRTRVFDYKI